MKGAGDLAILECEELARTECGELDVVGAGGVARAGAGSRQNRNWAGAGLI